MKNAVFWYVTPCGSFKNRHIASIISKLAMLVTANVVPSWLILFTLMMEAMRFSETPVLTRPTQRYIPEDSIL
jgi:hypothetical protein